MKSIQLAAAAGNPDAGSRPLAYVNGNSHGQLSQNPHASEPGNAENNHVQGGVLPMDEKALSGLQARMERLKSGTLDPH